MAKIEYRAVPRDVWMIVRYERGGGEEGAYSTASSSQCGEFPNEELANKYGAMIARSEDGASYISRGSMNRAVSKAVK